ncbi:MAG: Ig-like domain-containing protein [Acidimicrobiia bacterium]
MANSGDRDIELDGMISGQTVIVGLVTFALLALSSVVLFLVRTDAATEIRGNPGTAWLSGETRGRVVLAAAGGERPSIGLQLGDEAAEYDMVDFGLTVLVQNRGTGEIAVVDGGAGTVTTTVEAKPPADERRALVQAGSRAFLVDPVTSTAQTVSATGELGEEFVIEHGFTDWVGTADGRLWLVNKTDGSYSVFNGQGVDRRRFTDPGADLVLTAVGGDPVVLDRDNARLRWLRRDSTIQIEDGANAVIQDPDPVGTCVHVFAAGSLSCVSPDGPLRTMPLASPSAPLPGAQLFGNRYNAVLTWPGRTEVVTADWKTQAVEESVRAAPSARRTVGWSTTGPVLIDDPGSQYALTIDGGRVVTLDKFSRRTVLVSPDGSQIEGTGVIELDEQAETVGEIVGAVDEVESAPVVPNNDGRNDPPQANDDAAVTREGRDVVIGVLNNDVDPDGDVLSVVRAGPLSTGEGDIEVIDATTVRYAAPEEFTGEVNFPYTVADPSNLEDSATVTVRVVDNSVNSTLVARDDEATTPTNTSVDIPVLLNDVDEEGDPLTITALSRPTNGSATPTGDGRVRYEPKFGFAGVDRFTYTVIDGFDGEATATVTVTVTAPAVTPSVPDAVDDRATAVAGQRTSISVLENDKDPNGGVLGIVDVTRPTGLDISIVNGQTIDVTPSSSIAGLLSFTYTIENSAGLRDTATVALVVEPPVGNRPPRAVDDRATSASVSIPVSVLANDSDPDGDLLAIVAWTQPNQGGSVTRTSPSTLLFTPAPVSFRGTAQFSYTISDSSNQTATAKVTVEVIAPVGSGPVARDDSATVFVGETATISPLANDSHPDGLSFNLAGPPIVREGTATVNPDNTISYVPPATGPGVFTLNYTIQDSFLRTSSARITVNVVPKPIVNRPPVANNDVTSTPYQAPTLVDVLANDSDADNDAITLKTVSPPAGGKGQTVIVGNKVRYTPPNGQSGLATFTYTIEDPSKASATGTVLVQIADRIKVAPIANPDLVTMVTGTTTTVSPLTNDVDPDGAVGGLKVNGLGSVSGASATIVNSGTAVRIVAGPTPGSYDLPYTIIDPDGLTAPSIITVVVNPPPNQLPVTTADAYSILPVGSTAMPVMNNDFDPDGGTLTLLSVSAVSPANAGTAVLNGSQVSFTPNTNYTGNAQFTYVVQDAQNGQATGTVNITVNPCPEPAPALTADSAYTKYLTPVAIGLFGNDASSAGVLSVTQPSDGTVTVQSAATGTVLYTPPAGFNGVATFSYTITTTCDVRATTSVSVTVNTAPSAVNDSQSTTKNRAVSFNVLANDTDPDGDVLNLVVNSIASVQGGTVTASANGDVTFSPTPGNTPSGSFTYRARDAGGLTSNVATVNIAISNQLPIANPDATTMFQTDASVTVNVVANDSDPDSGDVPTLVPGSVTVASATPALQGTVAPSGNSIVFTKSVPVLAASTTIVVNYTISDGAGGTASSTLTITMKNNPPTAVDDGGTPGVPIPFTSNDTDPDGDVLTVTVAPFISAVTGTPPIVQPVGIPVTTGGSVTFTLTDVTFKGTVTLSYTIADGRGGTSTGKITITVA